MKVLLINPISDMPYPVLPLGLAYIAAYLRKHGIEVQIIDAWAWRYSLSQLQEKVSAAAGEIIGITVNTPTYEQARETIKACRRAAPQAVIVLGGPHPSALPRQILRECPEADITVQGEGEIVMLNICRALEKGQDLLKLAGIAFRRDGGVIATGQAPEVADLDSLPPPARELFSLNKYQTHPPYGRKNPYGTMVTQRGCSFQCTYCSKTVFGRRLRLRSVENVLSEIFAMTEELGIREIHFYDDIFTVNKKWIHDFCSRLNKVCPELSWSCTTRVDLVDEEMLREMAEAGCWMISYGVESGSQKILDSVKKGYRLEQVREAFALTKKAGIRTIAYYMIGFPADNEATIKETVDFVVSLKPDFASLGIGVLLPGSPLYAAGRGEGEEGSSREDALQMTPLSEGKYQLMSDSMSREQLEELAKWATKRFYLRFSYLFHTVLNIRTWEELKGYLKAGLITLKWSLT